ncbi:MAG: hypothetical protein EBQ86_10485 [Betaproteobacteria bacterium]|jgi:hypothetical protein|nr:hypothetical protein [Burkholderiales bacterium]NBX90504.1 hypothetical protein [Betaproteobacteria bacterium]
MSTASPPQPKQPDGNGVWLQNATLDQALTFFQAREVAGFVELALHMGGVACGLKSDWVAQHAPAFNTLGLADQAHNLAQEILLALLLSPHTFSFVDLEALASGIRVRQFMAEAASKTALAFKTEAAERPAQFWHYEEDAGFILHAGQNLIEALISATQPEATGKLYDFSCYRASEYVILLGLAQEAQICNLDLLTQLQRYNEVHAIRSGQFHDVFLVEYGSMENPLPAHFYVPGDRLWFRNPHEASADVTGYEGSWVIYMGGGLFSNFWKRDQPFTLTHKCVEINHWRDGLVQAANGEWVIDEERVEACVAQTLSDPQKLTTVLQRMMRMRDPKGVYDLGGCLDTTREHPRQIHPHHCELVLPALPI